MERRFLVLVDPDCRYDEGDIGVMAERQDDDDSGGWALLTMHDGMRWWFPAECVEEFIPEGCVKVSSLDYINNTELSDDDKEIIRTTVQSW